MALTFNFVERIVGVDREFSGRVTVRTEIWWRAMGLPYDVWVRAARPGLNGRLRCSQFLIETEEGSELLARQVQKIRLGQIMDELQFYVMSLMRRREPVLMAPELRSEIERLWPDHSPARPTLRRSVTSRELLEEFAAEYRRLVASGDRVPFKTMANRHPWKATRSKAYPNGHSYSAVNLRRIRRLCVKEGLLGPSIPGKAGERPTPRRRKR